MHTKLTRHDDNLIKLAPFNRLHKLSGQCFSHMVRQDTGGYTIDWERLAFTTRLALRFLDDVIEVERWPAPQVTAIVQANRKVGLGVMGFAELLILLGIPYASDREVSPAEELMQFIAAHALTASERLAEERGVFRAWERGRYARQGRRVRNATRTSIAPTDTLSILAKTSASIEPLFALAYRRHALGEHTLTELNPLFLRYARQPSADGGSRGRRCHLLAGAGGGPYGVSLWQQGAAGPRVRRRGDRRGARTLSPVRSAGL